MTGTVHLSLQGLRPGLSNDVRPSLRSGEEKHSQSANAEQMWGTEGGEERPYMKR